MTVVLPLAPIHAPDAAHLHVAGQPGTFLTSLGPDVLTVFYRALPRSDSGFGFAALETSNCVVGFVSATTSVGSLFLQLGTRYITQFLPPLTARYVRQPSLAVGSVQTLLYPLMVGGEESDKEGATAELLSIMVQPQQRGRGIGGLLVNALVDACHARKIALLDVTVDAKNNGARRFYTRHQFALHKSFTLYGREMCQYRRKMGDVNVG